LQSPFSFNYNFRFNFCIIKDPTPSVPQSLLFRGFAAIKENKKIQLILLLTNQSTVSLQTLIAGPKRRDGGDGSGSAAVAGGLGYWLR